ncbi:MAG: RNA 2',3'-cyclic phosphodiesterase [Methanobacteriaceae archaeon]|nr:RNA 2',3'-cyclic phosphodiesterase [Methanobacteriaceae archaeon]
MRSFLAIEIKSELKEDILNIQKEFLDENSRIKFVEKENLHLTLKFFGDINDKKIKEIESIITHTLSNYNSFQLNLEKIGVFPNKKHPKVIWIGTHTIDNVLVKLIKELDKEFNNIGFQKEKSYIPHLTIARVKYIDNKEKLINTLNKLQNISLGNMNITSIKLKSSKLTPNGPIYSTINSFKIED